MRVVDILGSIAMALVGVGALSLILQPNGGFSQAVAAITNGFANDVRAAKAVPGA